MGIAADFVLVLLAGLVGGLVARALRLPLLVGYIAAGVAVGPHTAGPTVVQIRDIELLAEIGVALLLFSLGLEISLADLKPVRRVALLGGPLQIALSGMLGGAIGVWMLEMPKAEAAWLGAMVSLSSTMVVLKLLSASGTTATLASKLMIGLLVVQDLAVVPMLIILPLLGRWDRAAGNIFQAVSIATAFLFVMVWLGPRLLPRALIAVLRLGSRELFLVAVVTAGVGIGYASHAAGLSFALGAFVAGLVLSESDLSHQALSDVVPLRDIFGLLFFVTVGMLFDPGYVWRNPAAVIAMTTAIVAGKAAITGTIARAFGYGNKAPFLVGLGLSQIGEFSFVLARAGRASGAISPATYDLTLSCTIVTMALSPLLLSSAIPLSRVWRRLGTRHREVRSIPPPPKPAPGGVLVAGWGRTGRAVARVLQAAGVPLRLIELDHALLGRANDEGIRGVWGDASRPEILHAAGVEVATVLVLAVPDVTVVRLAAKAARSLNPQLVLVARAAREEHVEPLRRAGVDVVIQPEFEGGLAMVRAALVQCGHHDDDTAQLLDSARAGLYSET